MSYNIQGVISEWYAQQTPEVQSDFRTWLITELNAGPLRIKFEKADSSIREMYCTLQEGVIPDVGISEEVFTDSLKEDTDIAAVVEEAKRVPAAPLVVWDLEQNAWRSFRLDRLKEIL